jgi:hypothetical protein
MVRIKCVKLDKCPICGEKGSCQVFLTKQNKLKYGRVRHIIHKGETGYNATNKYNFNYCKIANLNQLETLLNSIGFKLPQAQQNASVTNNDCEIGQVGQDSMGNQAKLGQANSGLISKIKGAGSSVRIEHHPPKVGVVGSNPTPPVCDMARTAHIGYLRFLDISQLLVF